MKLPNIRRYPKKILVRGEIWYIKFVRKIGTASDLGECDPSDRIIKIKLGQGAEETLKTFIHEIIHAIENEYDFDLPHTDKNDVVSKLENGIYSVLINNPDMWG